MNQVLNEQLCWWEYTDSKGTNGWYLFWPVLQFKPSQLVWKPSIYRWIFFIGTFFSEPAVASLALIIYLWFAFEWWIIGLNSATAPSPHSPTSTSPQKRRQKHRGKLGPIKERKIFSIILLQPFQWNRMTSEDHVYFITTKTGSFRIISDAGRCVSQPYY